MRKEEYVDADWYSIIRFVLLRLYIPLVFVVIFALTLGIKQGKIMDEQYEYALEKANEVITPEGLADRMTEQEVRDAYALFQNYKNLLGYINYFQDSVKMKADPMYAPETVMSYVITADNMSEADTQLISSFISLGIRDDLEGYWVDQVMFRGSESGGNAFTVVALGTDLDDSVALAGKVERALRSYASELAQRISGFTLTLCSSKTGYMQDFELMTEQTNQIERLRSLSNALNETPKELPSMVKTLYSTLRDRYDYGEPEPGNVSVSVGASIKLAGRTVSLKYALFGAVFGFAIGIILLLLLYVTRPAVLSKRELEQVMMAPCLGDMTKGNKDIVLATIISNCLINKTDKLVFAGNSVASLSDDEKASVQKKMQDAGISVSFVNNILENAEELAEAAKCGYVVTFETVRKSKTKALKKQRELMELNKIVLIGSVLV